MTKFEPGDVVRIEPKWLDDGEDALQDYIVIEDLTDEVFPAGRVKVICEDENCFLRYRTFVYGWDMVYKVGHTNLEKPIRNAC